MTKDIHHFLKESGYLNSPAERFIWKGASPSLRNHLRQFFLLALTAAVPISALVSGLTLLKGADRLVLFLCYLVVVVGLLALYDLLLTGLVRFPVPSHFWNKNKIHNYLPLPICAGFLFFSGFLLVDLVAARVVEMQFFIWAVLGLCCWLAAWVMRLLLVGHLYWHGIKPPHYTRHGLLTGVTMLLVAGILMFLSSRTPKPPQLTPEVRKPVLILAFDDPLLGSAQTSLLPDWPQHNFEVSESDITDFWTSLGTGATSDVHQASLLRYHTPLFAENLNREDPTQRLPLLILNQMGLTHPLGQGGRYRKYIWEIMDDYALRAYAFSYWHSYPAVSQNGGILSERWRNPFSGYPYLGGITPRAPKNALPLVGSSGLRSAIGRENQTWSQLKQRATAQDFDFCIAYFPLADLFDRLEPPDQQSRRAALFDFRQQQLTELLSELGDQVQIGVFVSSGKRGAASGRINVKVSANWSPDLTIAFNNHLEPAPTLLQYFGLPADRLMATGSVPLVTKEMVKRVDYGEPPRNKTTDPQLDSRYYEELKSLGYVQ